MTSIKQQLILQKIEAIYGTDSVPVGAQALLVEGLDVTPLEMSAVEVDYALAGFSKEKSIPAGMLTRVRYSADFVPSGNADVAPAFGPSLRACGLLETITAATSVGYTPISQNFEGVTIYAFIGATRHRIVGCRGTVTLDAPAGRAPKLNFEMTGFYRPPTDETLPTPVYDGLMQPRPVNKANTEFEANNVPLVLNTFSMQLGNTIQHRDRPNYESVDIDERGPNGSFSIHQSALASFNPFTFATTAAALQLELTHDLGGGHEAALLIPVGQARAPAYGADGNQRLVTIGYDVRRNPSGTDFSFLFT